MIAFPKRILLACGFAAMFGALPATAQTTTTGWSVDCISPRVCELKSEIQSGNSVAARLSVFNVRGHFFLQYTIPLGVDIKRGVRIGIDEEPTIATTLLNCSNLGCTGQFDLTPEAIQAMKQGSDMQIFFVSPVTQDTFAIGFTLSGFTAGFNQLTNP